MKKNYWDDYEITIGPSDENEEDCIKIPIHGIKQTDINNIMSDAYINAKKYLEDAIKVSDISRVVLASLSCELFFKTIIIKTKKKNLHIHSLYKLYCELSENEKETLISLFSENQTKERIEELIIIHDLSFEKIRYRHELSTFFYYEFFLLELASCLQKLSDKLQCDIYNEMRSLNGKEL